MFRKTIMTAVLLLLTQASLAANVKVGKKDIMVLQSLMRDKNGRKKNGLK